MDRTIRCPHCQSAIAIPPAASPNSEFLCPNCKGTMVLRSRQPEPPPVIRPTFDPPPNAFKQFAEWWRDSGPSPYLPGVALVCGIIFLLWSLNEPPLDAPMSFNALGCYLCLAMIGAAATVLGERKWKWRWTHMAGGLLTALAIFAWGYCDTYRTTWMSDTARYTDIYGYWSGRHLYRQLYHYSSAEECRADTYEYKYDLRSEGPMAGTGKPHGMWTQHVGSKHFADYIENKLPLSTTTFYWYGETISEGEWHLRNR